MSEKHDKNRMKNMAAMMRAESLAIVGISGPGRFGGRIYDNLQVMGYELRNLWGQPALRNPL